MSDVKIRDFRISDDIMEVVDREVVRIKALKVLSNDELAKLEKITKVYGLLMSSLRENVKHNLFGRLGGEALGDLGAAEEELDEGAEADDTSA